MGFGRTLAPVVLFAALWPVGALAHDQSEPAGTVALDSQAALARSRAAVGTRLGDFQLLDQEDRRVSLAQYRGRPLVVSVVFTACTQSCPLILQRLAAAAEVAREALGPESFAVVTLGLDPAVDTPERLLAYASQQGAVLPGWSFLGADHATIDTLTDSLGFTYLPSPRGFDHISQISIVDSQGVVAGHVYGDDFSSAALVEPLKAVIFDDLATLASFGQVVERIRLFCTFYDPKRDRYYFDYSFFIALTVGLAALLGLGGVLVRGWIKAGPRPRSS